MFIDPKVSTLKGCANIFMPAFSAAHSHNEKRNIHYKLKTSDCSCDRVLCLNTMVKQFCDVLQKTLTDVTSGIKIIMY